MPDAFQTLAEHCITYGYPALFTGVLLENAGVPVPGETAVLAAGFLSSPAGGGHFHLAAVIACAAVAAILGDNVSFWVGRRFARPRLLRGRGFLFVSPRSLEYADGYFRRYGAWTVFLARFVAGLRVVGALAAGTSDMRWPRFLLANAAGAVAWAVEASLLGYFFGRSWKLIHEWLGWGGVVAVVVVLVLGGVVYLWRRQRAAKKQSGRRGE